MSPRVRKKGTKTTNLPTHPFFISSLSHLIMTNFYLLDVVRIIPELK